MKKYEVKPLERFEWMQRRRYGVKFDFFYHEWAACLEKSGKIFEAIRLIEDTFKNELLLQTSVLLVNHLSELKLKTEKSKKFAFNDKLVYPDAGGEYSFEENRARGEQKVFGWVTPRFENYEAIIKELKLK